jgi:hypothetical protein
MNRKFMVNERFGIVAVEGLTCVGKTTLLHQLTQSIQALTIIPEVVVESTKLPVVPSFRSRMFFGVGRFFGNDILKSGLAKRSEITNTCLIDRYYVSTLSHRCAELKLSGLELESCVREVLSELSIVLAQPSLWLYITEKPSDSWRRYTISKPVDTESCWATEEGTSAISRAMDCCMKILEETSVVVRVASGNLSDKTVNDQLLGLIRRHADSTSGLDGPEVE